MNAADQDIEADVAVPTAVSSKQQLKGGSDNDSADELP